MTLDEALARAGELVDNLLDTEFEKSDAWMVAAGATQEERFANHQRLLEEFAESRAQALQQIRLYYATGKTECERASVRH
jgi:hypothetical protein